MKLMKILKMNSKIWTANKKNKKNKKTELETQAKRNYLEEAPFPIELCIQ